MGLGLQPDGLTAGLAGHCQPNKKHPVRPLQEEQAHILSTDVVKVESAYVTNFNPTSKFFCEFPSQIAHFLARA